MDNLLGEDKSEEEDKLELYSIEDIRLRTKKFMAHSLFGNYYENVLLILSVASCFEYIYQTYLIESSAHDTVLMNALTLVEKLLAVVFMFDWMLSFFLGKVCCLNH